MVTLLSADRGAAPVRFPARFHRVWSCCGRRAHLLRRENARGPVSEPLDGVGDDGDARPDAGAAVPVAPSPKMVENTLSTTLDERGAAAAGAAAVGAAADAAGCAAVPEAAALAREAAIVASTSEEVDAVAPPGAVAAALDLDADFPAVGAGVGTSGTASTPGGAAAAAVAFLPVVALLPLFLAAAAAVTAAVSGAEAACLAACCFASTRALLLATAAVCTPRT